MNIAAILTLAAIVCSVFLVVLLAMAVGVMFGRRSISGSCGGLGNKKDADGKTSCSLCENPSDACRELKSRMQEPAEQDADQSQDDVHQAAR